MLQLQPHTFGSMEFPQILCVVAQEWRVRDSAKFVVSQLNTTLFEDNRAVVFVGLPLMCTCVLLQCVAVCCSVLQCVAVCCVVFMLMCTCVFMLMCKTNQTYEWVMAHIWVHVCLCWCVHVCLCWHMLSCVFMLMIVYKYRHMYAYVAIMYHTHVRIDISHIHTIAYIYLIYT